MLSSCSSRNGYDVVVFTQTRFESWPVTFLVGYFWFYIWTSIDDVHIVSWVKLALGNEKNQRSSIANVNERNILIDQLRPYINTLAYELFTNISDQCMHFDCYNAFVLRVVSALNNGRSSKPNISMECLGFLTSRFLIIFSGFWMRCFEWYWFDRYTKSKLKECKCCILKIESKHGMKKWSGIRHRKHPRTGKEKKQSIS